MVVISSRDPVWAGFLDSQIWGLNPVFLFFRSTWLSSIPLMVRLHSLLLGWGFFHVATLNFHFSGLITPVGQRPSLTQDRPLIGFPLEHKFTPGLVGISRAMESVGGQAHITCPTLRVWWGQSYWNHNAIPSPIPLPLT